MITTLDLEIDRIEWGAIEKLAGGGFQRKIRLLVGNFDYLEIFVKAKSEEAIMDDYDRWLCEQNERNQRAMELQDFDGWNKQAA
jgi:hypothetical protein